MRAYQLGTALAHREAVTELYLHNSGLSQLPPVIFGMPKLEKLEFSANHLREIPPQIGQLRQLKSLSLHSNEISQLPPQLFQLKNLKKLDLSNNRIEALPENIGQLRQLEALLLHTNQLTHLPESTGKLEGLRRLEIQSNQLKKLPASIGNLHQLRHFRAGANQIGRLPKALFRLQQLEWLDLSNNRIATLSEALGALEKLGELNLRGNRLKQLPASIGKLMMLRRLLLSNNRLRELPATIAQLQWLAALYLDGNRLAAVTDELAACRRLEHLSLRKNQLRELPLAITELEALRTLDISDNHFEQLPALPQQLERLSANGNRIGRLPGHLMRLHRLQSLEASKNEIAELPEGFHQLHRLEKITLDGNPLSDIPAELFLMQELQNLQGLGNARARKKLLRFLKLCRSREVPSRLRLLIYDILEEGGQHLAEYPVQALLEALLIGMSDAAYPIRRHLLYERSDGRAAAPFQKGNTAYLLGETGYAPRQLSRQLESIGLHLADGPDDSVDVIVLGRLLRAMNARIPKGFRHIVSRPALTGFLNRELGRQLALSPKDSQVDNLRQMLFSPETANRQLALQLLQSNGLPPALLTDLFLAWKLGFGKQAALEGLLLQNASEEALRAMYYPLGLSGNITEATLTTNILKYSEDNEFDGKRIADFLFEQYGAGRYYLRRFHQK